MVRNRLGGVTLVAVVVGVLGITARGPARAQDTSPEEIRRMITAAKSDALELARMADVSSLDARKADLLVRVPYQFGKIAGTREGLAQLVEDPQIKLDVSLGGSITIPRFGSVSGEVGPDNVKFSAEPLTLAKLGVSAETRKVELFAGGQTIKAGDFKTSMQSSVAMTWDKNLDVVGTLPQPPVGVGSKLARQAVEKFVLDYPTEEARGSWDAQKNLSNALIAAGKTAVEDFRKSVGMNETKPFIPETFNVKATNAIETPGGGISTSQAIQWEVAEGKEGFRTINEASFNYDLTTGGSVTDVRAIGGKLRKVEGKVSFNFSVSDDPRPEKLDVRRQLLGKQIREGASLPDIAVTTAKWLWPLRVTEEAYLEALKLRLGRPLDDLSSDQIVQLMDPKVGGVRLCFGTGLVEDGISIDDFCDRLDQLCGARKQANNFMVGAGETIESPVVVPLDGLEKAVTLGLTRVRGFVVDKKGAVSLVGIHEAGRPEIPVDDLVVALRSIFKAGQSPFVSLDPDPADPGGPQKVRVGGMPRELEHTGFVHAMLEADYLMKRIDLGDFAPGVPGFKSGYQILRQSRDEFADTFSRMWFTPLIAPCGDVVITRANSGKAVWFESRIQVQTESMRRTGNSLTGTGETAAHAREAAANLTRYFSSLCEQPGCEPFARLQQVFDVAKLCALLRVHMVSHTALDKMCALAPARVAHADHYQGIGPKIVEDTYYFVSGGATSRARISARATLAGEWLAPLIEAANNGRRQSAAFQLPALCGFDASQAEQVNVELQANAAYADMLDGRNADALRKLDAALALDPEHAGALATRGICRAMNGDYSGAKKDIAEAQRQEPELVGVRAFLAVLAGDVVEGTELAAQAERLYHDNTDVLALCAGARLYAEDFAGAEKTANALLMLAPLDIAGRVLRTELAVLYKLSPAEARQRVAAFRGLPFGVTEAIVSAQTAMLGGDMVGAARGYRKSIALLKAAPQSEALRKSGLVELVMYMTAQSCDGAVPLLRGFDKRDEVKEARDAARDTALELEKMHPDWPTAKLLLLGLKNAEFSREQRMEWLLKAAELDLSRDGLLAEMNRQMGTKHAEQLVALQTLQSGPPFKSPKETQDGLRALGKLLGDSVLGTLIRRSSELMDKAIAEGKTEPSKEEGEKMMAEMVPLAEQVLEAIKPGVTPDAMDILSVVMMLMLTSRFDPEMAPADAKAAERCKRVVNNLRFNGGSETALRFAGNLTQNCLAIFFMELMRGYDKNPHVIDLKTRAGQGKLAQVEITRQAAQVFDAISKPMREGLTPCAEATLRWWLSTIGAAIESDALRAYKEHLAAFGPEMDAERNAVIERGKLLIEGLMPVEPLEEALALVTFESELRGIAAIGDQITRQLSVPRPDPTGQWGRLRSAVGKLRGKVANLNFGAVNRDWVAWSRGETGDSASGTAPTADGKSGAAAQATPVAATGEQGPPWLVFIGIGGAAGVLAALVLTFRRKPQPPPA